MYVLPDEHKAYAQGRADFEHGVWNPGRYAFSPALCADYVAEYQGDGWTDEQMRGYHKYVRELRQEIVKLEQTRTALYAERVALDRQTRIGDE